MFFPPRRFFPRCRPLLILELVLEGREVLELVLEGREEEADCRGMRAAVAIVVAAGDSGDDDVGEAGSMDLAPIRLL